MNDGQFILFAGDTYYPSGGVRDFVGRYQTLTQAINVATSTADSRTIGWWHVATFTGDGDFAVIAEGDDPDFEFDEEDEEDEEDDE